MRQYVVFALVAPALAALAGCATVPVECLAVMEIPRMEEAITVDGLLEESCYRSHPPLQQFVVAGNAAQAAPLTRVWLFWNEDRLICTFACEEATLAALPPSSNEKEVDGQDRVEIFIWKGGDIPLYHCIEAAPDGAVHDYAARFYRNFDDGWSPPGGWSHRARLSPEGYAVEMVLPGAALEDMGITLISGSSFRLGLFRADYDVLNGVPTWIAWVDHGREPDFHVADSFGKAVLTGPKTISSH